MSWGSTAFTPIVTRNEPPFGFHEAINPPDFKVCNQNPWGTGERVKREIQDALKLQEYRNRLNVTNRKDFDMGYDLDYDHVQRLRCAGGCGTAQPAPFAPLDHSNILEKFMSGNVFGFTFTEAFTMGALCVFIMYFVLKKGVSLQ
jgi:hypothetical protein